MAYALDSANSRYLTIGTSSDFSYTKNSVFTVAARVLIPSVSTSIYQIFNKQQNSGNGTGWSVFYFHQQTINPTPGAGDWLGMQKRVNAGTTPDQMWTNISFTASSSTWYQVTASTESAATSGTKLYADGVKGTNQNTSDTLAGDITNAVVPQINGRNGANNLNTFNASEVAIWTVQLTDDEVASLGKGFKPQRIRPQSLVFYAPLIRTLQDTRAGLTITNNNSATVADHPRVY